MYFEYLAKTIHTQLRVWVRDRPFNLKGGYGFLFRSEICFRTTRELEYLFFMSRKALMFFFPEFNIRLYDKNVRIILDQHSIQTYYSDFVPIIDVFQK
jgi:hypothetical protein